MLSGLLNEEKKIPLIIDHREKQSGAIEAFGKIDTFDIELKNLDVGDYLINNQWLFERKTFTDFSSSIIDGRLFNQALQLISSTKRPILILEGTAQHLKNSGISRESMQGALIKLSVILKIPILRAKDINESVQLMLYVTKQFNGLSEKSLMKSRKSARGKRRTQLQILQSLPGIGFVRAKCLLDKFGSVSAVIQADKSELLKVPGIGKDTIRKIYWAIK